MDIPRCRRYAKDVHVAGSFGYNHVPGSHSGNATAEDIYRQRFLLRADAAGMGGQVGRPGNDVR